MTAQTTQPTTVTLTIDGKSITVPKGTTVFKACQKLGIDIPIFCYQDRMPPFGACRVCLVEVEKMPKLQTSCTLECAEGMVVKTNSQAAENGREGILEFLLINHPLDCPICDRGGECALQEQTLTFGPAESRFYEDKRHFPKALSLSPVLKLDRERCIVCARCTRFGDILAGDHALEFIDRGFKTEVGTPDGKDADSKFIGNTIMICPVGALTSDVYRFRARPWDNQPTDSTCTLCPVGCSMIIDSRDGDIMRTRSRENHDVNDIWLCDKGWFGYEYTSSLKRLSTPLIRREGALEIATWPEALNLISKKFAEAKPKGKLAGWGGNPLTVEENYLFQQLFRQCGGVDHVDHRIGMPIFSPEQEGLTAGMVQSIGEAEELDYAVLFGLDLTEEFPVIWLRLRQAINKGAKVIFAGHFAPEIAPYMHQIHLHAPGKELEIIHQVQAQLSHLEGKGAIFVGSQYLASPQRASILSQLQTIPLPLNIMEGRNNSMGARFAGMHPGPKGLNALQVLETASTDGWDFLYVAGANPAKKFPKSQWAKARSKIGFLVVQDLFLTDTAKDADVILPTLSYVEKGGSFLNIEGRFQTLLPGKEVPENMHSDGSIFSNIAKLLNQVLTIDPKFSQQLNGRISFQRPTLNVKPSQPINTPLSATFAHALFDNGVRVSNDPHVSQLVKPPRLRLSISDGVKHALRTGDSIKVAINGNSIIGKVKLDDKVAAGTIVIPLGFNEIPANELGINLLNGVPVEIAKEK